jgi:predicted dehydrogenase
MPKRIGFVDNKLENFHANVFLKAFRTQLKERGWTVAGCYALDADNGRAWAAHNDVPWFADPRQLEAHVDAYMILAPSNPELHLGLAEQVLPFGKPTYIDKTFAPDVATAQKIFALADQHKTPVQTASALRYTNVQDFVKEAGGPAAVQHVITWGGGGSFAEYAIHPVELLISCTGAATAAAAQSLMRRGSGDYSQLLINFADGRTGVANVYTRGDTPFAAGVTTATGTKLITVDASKIFVNNAAAVLDLFESRKPNVDRAETLAIRRILDVAEDPAALKGFVVL